jgi:hypothetical protein
MSFSDYTDDELNKTDLLPEGEYDFEIVKSELTTSKKSGNEMIALLLRVFDDQGGSHFVNDYIVASPNMKWKIKSILSAVNLPAPIVSDDLPGRSGKVQIKLVPAGEFPAKNEVKAYGEKAGKASSDPAPQTFKPSAPAPVIEEDDIPF